MPKLKNSVPKYRRHRASGQAVVTLSGRDFYLGPHNSKTSVHEYDRLVAEWLANNRSLPAEADSPTTIEELLASFWQYAVVHYVGLDGKPTSEVESYRQAMKPVRSLYAGLFVNEFGPRSLKTVRKVYISKGLARKTVNRQIGRIKRIFKWGVSNELVQSNVFQALQAVEGLKRGRSEARETEPIKPVDESLVEKVKPYVSRQVWAMIQLQVLTGMRCGEVIIMRMCDINRTNEVWEYRPSHHKTAYQGRERIVFLGKKAQSIIISFQDRDSDKYLFSPKEAREEANALRRASRKTPMTPSQRKRTRKSKPKKSARDKYDSQTYGRAIANATKKAKCQHWTSHQLRHTAATTFREEYGLEAAQVLLGHSKADVTQLYAAPNHKRAAQVMLEIG